MKKNRDRGKTTLLCEKESFLNAREFSHTLLFAFVCSSERERERERKRKTKKTHFTPAKSVRLVVLPCFLLLDSFEYLLKREEEEEQSLGEERNSST